MLGAVGEALAFSDPDPAAPFNADRLHCIPKQRHRVTNWAAYDASLRQRGRLTAWFTGEAIAAWKAEARTTCSGQPRYSGTEACLVGVLALVAAFVRRPPTEAQHRHHGGAPGEQAASPYAGMQAGSIKTLSEQQVVADLRARRGMGMTLAAELNGDPGPVHALELADALGLVPEQRRRIQALREAMTAEAIPPCVWLFGPGIALLKPALGGSAGFRSWAGGG